MKQITNYIIEKFKINSKTVANNNLKIDFEIDKSKSDFTSNEIDEIIKFIKSLPILPNKVVAVRESPKMSEIVLRFGKEDKDYENNIRRIFFISIDNKYKVGFRKTLFDNIDFYPGIGKRYFNNLQECFDCINKNWKKWEKYLENPEEE